MLSYFDSRDINRGPIEKHVFYDAIHKKGTFNNIVYEKVKKLIKVRKQYLVMSRGKFVRVKTDSPEIFAYVRETEKERVVVINNLSQKRLKAVVTFTNDDFGKKPKDLYMKDLLTDKMIKVKVENKDLTTRLNPYSAMWLKL